MKSIRYTLILAALLATATLAHAHAFLDHAEPRVGSTLAQPPSQVKIWFTEELEGAFSKIQVFDAAAGRLTGRTPRSTPPTRRS